MSRTPLRVSFVGGGTDIPQYSDRHGGAVISASINKYIYVTIANHFYKDMINVRYSQSEESVKDIKDIKHPIVREALNLLRIRGGIQISSITEIPSKGTGMGSSSSFTVGLLKALHEWQGDSGITPTQLAEEAITIERYTLKEYGGKQDQYVAAFGGILFMEFKTDGTVSATRIKVDDVSKKNLNDHLMLVYTGGDRDSSELLKSQSEEFESHIDTYHMMKSLAHGMHISLLRRDWHSTGRYIDENWKLKRTLSSSVSTPRIEEIYDTAKRAGAEGAKLMGAGNTGFMLIFSKPDTHEPIMRLLRGLWSEPFTLTDEGSKIVYVGD